MFDKLDQKEEEKRYFRDDDKEEASKGVVKCIKDKDTNILVQDKNIKNDRKSILISYSMENKKML